MAKASKTGNQAAPEAEQAELSCEVIDCEGKRRAWLTAADSGALDLAAAKEIGRLEAQRPTGRPYTIR